MSFGLLRLWRVKMKSNTRGLSLMLVILVVASSFAGTQEAPANKVYGEWLIRVKPDQGKVYNELVKEKGLPLFRESGGRMVGWWNTLIGNVYEHVTIWEHGSMADFEKAVKWLGRSDQFAEFVKLRDPLLDGEDSRFLRLADGGEVPALPETAELVIHELHHVPFTKMGDYLRFMKYGGLATLKKHGFRPVGPLVVEVGKWSEVTYLFLFKSLEEREQLRFAFQSHPDSQIYGGRLGALVSDLTTRVLVPSPLMLPMGQARVDGLNSDQFPTDVAGVLGSDRSENGVFNIDKMDLWPSLVHVRSRPDEDRAFPILLKNSKPWNRPYRAVPGLFRFNR